MVHKSEVALGNRLPVAALLLFLLFLATPFAAFAAPGDVFYVDPSNSSANDANVGTESQPWRTLALLLDRPGGWRESHGWPRRRSTRGRIRAMA